MSLGVRRLGAARVWAIERIGNIDIQHDPVEQPQCGIHLLDSAGSLLYLGRGCAFAQSHRPCHVLRGEYAGAEMWKPHCGLSGLSSFDSRPCALHAGRACAFYAGADRFRTIGDLSGSDNVAAALRLVGQVVLYRYRPNALNRPDSSRPQAARSRVACAERCGCRLSLPEC